MAQPYSTTAQVLGPALKTLVTSAGWNVTDPGSVKLQDITYSAAAFAKPPVTVNYVAGGTAGAEVVTVAGNTVTVKIQSGTSTATQVLAAWNASAAAVALATASITGTAGSAQSATTAPTVVQGDVAALIAEGDSKIDSRLAGLEVSLPFAANPDLIQQLSVLHARYAVFRELYSAGKPSSENPRAQKYKDEFEELWMHLEEGWSKLVDSTGAQVAMSKFATLTIPYPCPAGGSGDQYPNFPSGPYPDPPGIGY